MQKGDTLADSKQHPGIDYKALEGKGEAVSTSLLALYMDIQGTNESIRWNIFLSFISDQMRQATRSTCTSGGWKMVLTGRISYIFTVGWSE